MAAFARSLPLDRLSAPTLDPASHYLGRGADTAAFIITLDAINFGSGWFPFLKKRSGMSGYFTVATSLAEHYRAHGPPTVADLEGLDAARCAAMFGQSLDQPDSAELMGLFARALNDLGRCIGRGFGGRFDAFVEAARGSASRLVEQLLEMPFYRDVERYRGRDVPFLKRAQITVADLAIAFDHSGLGRFDDLDQLTIFADNLVPHVLRVEGVLDYDPALVARILREEVIPIGTEEEVEIRASAVTVVERIVAVLRSDGHRVTPQQVDYVLWNRGQEPRFKAIPRHRCRSTFY